MADDYTHVIPDGSVIDKAQDLESFTSGERRWEIAHSDQHIMRIYGENPAVMVGLWRGKGTNAGQHFNYRARITSVYVRGEQGWQMVNYQSTPIPEAIY